VLKGLVACGGRGRGARWDKRGNTFKREGNNEGKVYSLQGQTESIVAEGVARELLAALATARA
jgi:hypothetical protein